MKTAITILFGKLEEIKAELAEIGKNEEGLNEEGLKPTMTVEELASFLNISLSHAYQQLGFSIPARRVGRRWVISRAQIYRWFNNAPAKGENSK